MQKVDVNIDILSKNNQKARELRAYFAREGLFVINLMSAPGSGKTTLLESFACRSRAFAVIEGDLQTQRDANRLHAKGIEAYQISTGDACHLEAYMITKALQHLAKRAYTFLFIENVGNLVCPASYDLGAHMNVVLLSVSEGDDKVLKYPTMFLCADAIIITKTDLMAYFNFHVEHVRDDLEQLGKNIPIFLTSDKDVHSINNIWDYLIAQKEQHNVSRNTI